MEERQAWRRALRVGLYDEVGDNTLETRMPTEIAAAVGAPDGDLDSVTNWCAHKGLIAFASMHLDVDELRELEAVLHQIDQARENGEIQVAGEDAAQLDADVDALRAQVRAWALSPRVDLERLC